MNLLICNIDGTEKKYGKEACGKCDFYHPYTVCTWKKDAKKCPIDNRYCNSSSGHSSIYDCRNDYGFELRPCKGAKNIDHLKILWHTDHPFFTGYS